MAESESSPGRFPASAVEQLLVVKVGQHHLLVLRRKARRLRGLEELLRQATGPESCPAERTAACGAVRASELAADTECSPR